MIVECFDDVMSSTSKKDSYTEVAWKGDLYRCEVILVHNVQQGQIRLALYENPESILWDQDNAPAQRANITQLDFDIPGFKCLQHPPYSSIHPAGLCFVQAADVCHISI
ncbi:hypothetical protein MAR_007272 [Mya arenaria]|uniref:Uncharacterized protein n=1 Tax=Mya arenaria TaxID=6604 RepID=A0ABY7DAU8_MYAAR|nr:hypothetical protein MAR_007272 [Mya arenaria]